jgi:tRNA 2-thiouridine synthesizing protein A
MQPCRLTWIFPWTIYKWSSFLSEGKQVKNSTSSSGCRIGRQYRKGEYLIKIATIAMCATHLKLDRKIDISLETCPMTFVLVRLALDQMEAGQVLEIRLRGAEPRRNVPLTAVEQGHEVVSITDQNNGESIILLRRG